MKIISKLTDDIEISYGVAPLNVEIISWNADSQMIKYKVSGTPICQYDQHSRARVGIKFSNYKVSKKPKYVVYTQIWNLMNKDSKFEDRITDAFGELEKIRDGKDVIEPQAYNLMSRECSYVVEQSLGSLRGQMMRRLKFCEEEFIVGLHWLLREKMINMGIKEAESFRPGCDVIGKCDYSSADYLSNAFGCLFAGCGRFPSHTDFASFNQSCTTPEVMKEQLGIDCVRSSYEIKNNLRTEAAEAV